jgi:hypothetical protein
MEEGGQLVAEQLALTQWPPHGDLEMALFIKMSGYPLDDARIMVGHKVWQSPFKEVVVLGQMGLFG